MGFLSFLSPAITAASDVAGGYAQGQDRVKAQQQAQFLAAIKTKREDERQVLLNALTAAQTKAAGQIPVTYHDSENGDVRQLPTRIDAPPSAPPRPAQPGPEGPTTLADDGPKTAGISAPGPVPTAADSTTLGGKPSAPPTQVRDTVTPPPSPPPTIGVSAGFKGPKKAPVPGTPEYTALLIQQAKIKKEYGPQPQDDRTLVPVQQPDGSVVYMPRSKAAGLQVPGKGKGAAMGNLPAPMAAKVGQAGEMIKKLSDILPQMDGLDVNLGNSAGEDIAEKGIGAFGVHIPGTKGIGSLMVNRSPEYSKYEASLSPFVLAAAHALSGARINMDQVEQIRRSIKYEPGDTPPVKAQKRKNLIDLVNSITGSLPADAIAAQEDQMDPGLLATLKGYGYRPASRAGATPIAKTGAPTGDINLGDPTAGMSDADAWEAYRAQGLTAAQATAKVASRKK